MKRFLAGLLLAGALLVGSPVHAADGSYWTWYEKTQGTSKVDTVRFKTACINAEDSAAHLNLIGYRHGVAVYGCANKGY